MKTTPHIYQRFIGSGIILVVILAIGTLGYWLIAGGQYSLVDTFYMTWITITTIGFGEIVDLSGNAGGRLFTVFIALTGIGTLMYVVTNLTALVVEGEITESFRRRRMEKRANEYKDHYIVCGLGSVGLQIVSELDATKRPYVIVEPDKSKIDKTMEHFPKAVFIEGDATDNETLEQAGAAKAKGLFAATGDDNLNLIISVTAKQLNSALRVIARCANSSNSGKMARAGADAVISPSSIGGLRMASEMIRPTATSFLDVMLRDKATNLRVEEVAVPQAFIDKSISALNLKKHPRTLLLAVKSKESWTYHPPDDHVLRPDSVLVVMTTADERRQLEQALHGTA